MGGDAGSARPAARAATSAIRASAAEARRPIGPSCGVPTPPRSRSPGSRAADRAERRLGGTWPPAAGLRARVGAGHPHQHDRPRDPGQVPVPAGARRGLERRLPGRLEQLEPVHLVPPGLVQVLGLDAHRHVPAANGHAEVHGPVAQVLAERRVRHQQLGDQLAAGPDRQLAGVPGQVEQPRRRTRPRRAAPGSRPRPGPRARPRAVSSPATVSPTMIGTLTAPACPVGAPAPAGRASPSASRRSSTPVPSAKLTARRRPSRSAPVWPAAEHGGQALLGPGQGPLGAATGLPHDRLDQPGQLRPAGTEIERDAGPLGDVGRGHRRLPPLRGERGDRGHVVDRGPAQRHVEPVVGGRRRRAAGQHHQAPGGRRVQVGELLGQPHRHDLTVAAAEADPAQAGQWRAGQDLINGRHAIIMRNAQLVA